VLEALRDGRIDVDEGLRRLRAWPSRDLGHTQLDTHRAVRCGHPEVVYGAGKTASEILEIARAALEHHDRLLVTRVAPEAAALLVAEVPGARHHERARLVTIGEANVTADGGDVLVISAGTSDRAVAEEAAITARMLGARVEELRDVGVAGIHRLLAHTERIQLELRSEESPRSSRCSTRARRACPW
jgi:pyridinium-3,5-biscarboxylic acid mononucleotide synthase